VRREAQIRLVLWGALGVAGCHGTAPVDDGPRDPSAGYPSGPYAIAPGGVLPDLAFAGVTETGAPGALHLHDYLPAEAGAPGLLLVTVSGGLWCGTCRWHASHDGEIVSGRARRLDLILGDRDNGPAGARDAAAWRSSFHGAGGVAVGADPAFSLGAVLGEERAALPLFLVVDTGTMRVMDVLSNPDGYELSRRLGARLGELAGEAPPPAPDEALVLGTFHQNEWDLLRETTLPGAPPPDPTNAVADSPGARALGEKLFFDAMLSPSGQVSCATCHDPQKHLSDGRPRAEGVSAGDRRTPSIALSAHARWQSWDGRADTLWAQALGPLENPTELGSSRIFVARRIATTHGAAYAAAFPGEPLPDMSGWPEGGRPGEPAYDALPGGDRDAATRVFVHAAKAIAAYERAIRVKPNALDAYLGGQVDALTSDQQYGLELFVRSGCLQCHWGPRLTDDAFHDTRTPTGRVDGLADPGRLEGIAALLRSEFRANGRWSDSIPEEDTLTAAPAMLGQFKTPALRGVADAAFLGHGGAFDQLSGITEAYGHGGVPEGDPASAGARERWLPTFGETAQWGLVPFLRVETAEIVMP
jgi:cytochrome c peroxidase